MDLRGAIIVLVYALPVLVVAFGVLMGGYALSHITNDQAGATLCWRAATISLMLLVGNVVLLVGVLGAHTVSRSDCTNKERSDRHDLQP